MEYLTHNEAETEALGARLGAALQPGTVLAYVGTLGMGKTALTRGLAKGLGYTGRVTSPTFNIVNEYEGGRLPLFHFDMYRITDPDDLYSTGYDDYLASDGYTVAEWSEKVEEVIPEDAITVTVTRTDSESGREIRIDFGGSDDNAGI